MNSSHLSSKRKGFSLLEILVILAVLGVLLGLSGFLLGGYLRQQRLNEAARMFGETLRRVSELATTESQYFTLEVAQSGLRWKEKDATTFRGNIEISNLDALTIPTGGDVIEFTGRGLPQQGYLYILKLGTLERKVYLAATGAVMYP